MKIDAIGDFYNLAQVHDGNAGADVTHYGQIVGDKEIGQPESHLQVLDQVNDLRVEWKRPRRRPAHHLQAFGIGDVDEILKDYTEASVIMTPDGPLHGLDEIRPLFEKFTHTATLDGLLGVSC